MYTHSQEARKRMSLARLGKPRSGSKEDWKWTEESKKKKSLAMMGNQRTKGKRWKVKDTSKLKGRTFSEEHRKKISLARIGEKHWNWKKDRFLIARRQERNNPEYKQWRMQVWLRDKFRCRITNQDCDGKVEAHHILGWQEYVELRYEVNNGITLCHAHHPRKRAEEKRLIPQFQELVSVSN
jgi:hypothetical protein